MEDFLKWVVENQALILYGYIALEKIVKKSPCKWDDVLFDMILDPIFGNIKKKVGIK